MQDAFGYQLMKGTGNITGHIRCSNGLRHIQCRGLQPQEKYTLFLDTKREQEKAADNHGCLSFSCSREGFLFLCNQASIPILWQESTDGSGLFRARQYLQKAAPPKKTLPQPEQPPPAAPEPEEKSPPPRKQYLLRAPSCAPMAAALPRVQWSESLEKLRSAMAAVMPFSPFPLPGFRCARMPGPSPAIPFYITGYKTENSRVCHLVYALPGHPLRPPAQLPGCQWKSGWWYTVQNVKG